jgi:dipeptidyl aminopeptidase/acylaminoacyl peptidase
MQQTTATRVRVNNRPLVVGTPVTTRRYQGPSALAFSPDGGHLAFISGLGASFDAWRIPVRGGEPEAFFAIPGANLSGLSWSRSGELIASAHRGGTERWQIYARGADGTVKEIAVSAGDSVQHLLSQGAASPDGRFVAFSANDRNPEDVDLAIGDLQTGERRTEIAGETWHVAGYWSPDSRWLQVMRVEQNTDQSVLALEVESHETLELTPHDGEEQNVPAGWLADGRALVITNQGREHLWLAAIDLATGEREAIHTGDWDVELATSSADGTVQAWTINDEGWSRLHWRTADGGGGEVQGLDGVVGDLALSRDGRLAAYTYLPITGPDELRVLDTVTGESTTLLQADSAEASPRPESVRVPGPAGDIPVYVFRSERKPSAALVIIHGGPEGQSRPRIGGQFLRLLRDGITIVVPNVHGSTGYGKSWQGAIHRDWGGVDVADFKAIAEWLRQDPAIDSERIGVFGGSYGGFATLSCVTRLPEYWRCGVALYGPCNLVTMLEDAEPNWRRWNRRWIGDLQTDREKLVERSPLTHAGNVRCPMLLMSGANDPRVRKRESDQFADRLRSLGREVEYLSFDDEGHGVTRPENMAAATRMIEGFLRHHLLEEEGE